ncbi:hypothetical protein HYC85_013001 [Camellia sinensis]|uniref:FAF domain-containing protein n=1 Tax=Camellia sinensis TaxID=4442 RepID=A0A7J7HGC6_CAMSI|nr:hypothetical protein HYC85_013001 [Camellia sinensis]
MSTIVCQGLQSCLESQLTETRTLRLKLALPKPSFFETIEPPITQSSYLHQPMLNPSSSSSILSTKSLDLCTENLGSETGTDTIEISKFCLYYPASNDKQEAKTGEESKSSKNMKFKKVGNLNSRDFPPPLTTMNGVNSLHVRPHREGGRLVIAAMEDPKQQRFFQAERSHGRLRLSFWKDSEMVVEESEEESDMEEVEIEEDGEEEEVGEEESDGYVKEDMDANILDVGGEMGIEKFQWSSRCNEGACGNESISNWEGVWVSSS